MTKNPIAWWLTQFSDERLAALQAHTEDGKLSYDSCCCLVGSINTTHALQGWRPYTRTEDVAHLYEARKMPGAYYAERAFNNLAETDEERREKLLPLIYAEVERRKLLAEPAVDELEKVYA